MRADLEREREGGMSHHKNRKAFKSKSMKFAKITFPFGKAGGRPEKRRKKRRQEDGGWVEWQSSQRTEWDQLWYPHNCSGPRKLATSFRKRIFA